MSTLNADEAVADGCTLQAAILSPLISAATWKVQDVCSSNVEVSWDSPLGDDLSHEKEGAVADGKAKEGKDADVASVSAGAEGLGESVTLFKEGDAVPVTRRVAFRRSQPFSVSAKDKATGEEVSLFYLNFAFAFAFSVEG